MKSSVKVGHILTGRIGPLDSAGTPTGIYKQINEEPVWLSITGIVGDNQGDTRRHGGIEKALHHYPYEHYDNWIREHKDLEQHLMKPGAFGENISTTGLTEDQVHVGDIFKLGNTYIQIAQGRQPCWRLNARFGIRHMAKWLQRSGRTGWYYRVLEEGYIQSGNRLELIDRPQPDWPLSRILETLYHDTMNYSELEKIASLSQLAESWRRIARSRLEKGHVEDWSSRLISPNN